MPDSINYEKILNIVFIIFSFIFFLIGLVITLMHIKQPFIRQGFFKVVFIQVIFETIIIFLLLIINICLLIEKQSSNNFMDSKIFILFPIIFNFCYMGNISYNIQALLYLSIKKSENEELIDYDISNKNQEHTNSISFTKHSFKRIHLFSFIFTILHSIIFSLFIKNSFNIHYWYYYFFNGVEGQIGNQSHVSYFYCFFFILNLIFFCISLPYLFMSFNKERITEHIILKHYSIYSFLSSLCGLIFPLVIILCHFEVFDKKQILKYIAPELFMIYLIVTMYFRINCYYVQYILGSKGKSFMTRLNYGIKILFACEKIPEPNFIDYNSSFVLQSLSNFNDFVVEDTNRDGSEDLTFTYQSSK